MAPTYSDFVFRVFSPDGQIVETRSFRTAYEYARWFTRLCRREGIAGEVVIYKVAPGVVRVS